MNFDSFWADIIATLIGGIGLTFLFFFAREKLFPLPDVTGRWYLEMATVNTAYNPYEGMILRYVIMIWREGNILKGSAEKIYENSSTGEREYVGENRTRAVIEGYNEKNYLGKDRVYLHSIENGHGRESTSFYELLIKSDKEMIGAFNSMVANQDGTAKCQREAF
ncbi:hypothetical protein [Marinobacter piscensis]|uniref:hypothetical protein n=1 Tax=Marinobacter piscensis TaxID=1562308 RepID=UPI0011A811E6|nr:hypothetical protein [Marinobacter piscensis]